MSADFQWVQLMAASPVFLVLLASSVVGLGVAIERFLYFSRRSGNPDAALRKALADVGRGDFREAARACETSSHPFGAVASTMFRDGTFTESTLEERMQVALSEQKLLLEKNTGVLGTLAAVAPLVGLLGTVWGIMRAFRDMAAMGSAGPSVVAAGIAEALFTTATGIIIAVPALVTFNHFVRRMNTMLTVADNHSRVLRVAFLDALARRGAGAAPGRAPSPTGPETRPTPAQLQAQAQAARPAAHAAR
jgi:biopolymer transport protein ExbB